MTTELQTLFAAMIVLASAAYLIRAALRRRSAGEQCGGCGPDKFKASLKR